MDKSKIKKQAKEILDKFAGALEKVDSKEMDSFVDREEFERDEGELSCVDRDFKRRVLENAPNANEDFVLVERRGWK